MASATGRTGEPVAYGVRRLQPQSARQLTDELPPGGPVAESVWAESLAAKSAAACRARGGGVEDWLLGGHRPGVQRQNSRRHGGWPAGCRSARVRSVCAGWRSGDRRRGVFRPGRVDFAWTARDNRGLRGIVGDEPSRFCLREARRSARLCAGQRADAKREGSSFKTV